MALKALDFKASGANILKVKLGKNAVEDVERIRQIREAVGPKCSSVLMPTRAGALTMPFLPCRRWGNTILNFANSPCVPGTTTAYPS
jgi:hypothetical protein